VLELRIGEEPNYRQFVDAIKAFDRGILLLPDFQKLFREANHDLRVAFNQRRDLLASLDIAFLCFVEPTGSLSIPKLLPDWWSLRSLELEFEREGEESKLDSSITEIIPDIDSLSRDEKIKEIIRLERQVENADSENLILLTYLFNQLGLLHLRLSNNEEALDYLNKTLAINQTIGDKEGEAVALNNISQVYRTSSDLETTLNYLQQSLNIFIEISDLEGTATTLNNISQIYRVKGRYDEALQYLQESLAIQKGNYNNEITSVLFNSMAAILQAQGDYNLSETYLQKSLILCRQRNDKRGESIVLDNLGLIYKHKGDYEVATKFTQKSLKISREIGDKLGESTALNNIALLNYAKGEYKLAYEFLQESLMIKQEIGDNEGQAANLNNLGALAIQYLSDYSQAAIYFIKSRKILNQLSSTNIAYSDIYLDKVKAEIGEERFNEIVREIEAEETKPETP
jgi:tetratricopeptide (TPR) repeat protein